MGGRYQVRRFLGEGGKKRVYLSHDTKLDRDVAFALIKTEGLNAEGEARIRREAQAMGRLGDHPHIVPVYDIGEEGGQPYLVTQLMGGGDVEGLIEKAPDHRVPLEDSAADRGPGVPGAGVRPREGHRPSRSEAGQRLAHGGWNREARRLRAGGGAGPEPADAGRDDGRAR